MSISKRVEILDLIENQKNTKLEVSAEIPYMTIKGIKEGRSNPGFETLTKILNVFPRLNARWLILGEEPMFLSAYDNPQELSLVEDPALEYMKRSSLYNYPILVDEVEDLRKIVKELRKTIAELQETIESMNNKTEKKA